MRDISIQAGRDASQHVYASAIGPSSIRLDVPARRSGAPRPVYLKLETTQPINVSLGVARAADIDSTKFASFTGACIGSTA
jgi:hypothetical protein